MNKPVSRTAVEGFYKALANFEMSALADYLADDVVWTINGPIDILPFCGRRVGRDVVVKLLNRDIPGLLEKRRMAAHSMLVEGDRAAVFGKLTARRVDIGHPVSYRIAQFIRFENENVVEYTSIIDSFDAVEQVLGRQFTVPGRARATGDTVLAV